MKPRKNFRSRPKKSGAKKRQRTLAQGRRLKAFGMTDEEINALSPKNIRLKAKEAAKKSSKKAMKKKAAKTTAKPAAKKTAPKPKKKSE